MEEIWKPYEDKYFDEPKYEVSNYGRIRNIKTRHIMKISAKKGRDCAWFHYKIKDKQTSVNVPQLVYKLFSNDKPRVKNFNVFHKDGNKLNNHIDNLYVLESTLNTPSITQEDIYKEYI